MLPGLAATVSASLASPSTVVLTWTNAVGQTVFSEPSESWSHVSLPDGVVSVPVLINPRNFLSALVVPAFSLRTTAVIGSSPHGEAGDNSSPPPTILPQV